MSVCKQPSARHTIWYFIEGEEEPNREATFDDRKTAIRQAERWAKEARPSLRWMKVGRSDNKLYSCWWWENPYPAAVAAEPTPKPVKLIKKKRWWRKND